MLQPIGNNAQVQRLTTALKNICRDYPAGGTILRELLQNADDAGATEVRFFLDTTTYSVGELIDPKLDQYQGPALLAYNNAIFTDKDFKSLSRLGDSLKIEDGSTTGKFGRGFNSVYNWTDSPSIVSRERLVILDPHCEWSPGGPVYDFVENSDDPAIKNQMIAYHKVIEHPECKLDGTVIRIPLRTDTQAAKSEISNHTTTASEILDVLKSFALEFGDSGLLFMRNVEKLEIGAPGLSILIEMVDGENIRSHKSKVNSAVKEALIDFDHPFDYSFEAGIEYKTNGELRKTTFILHHSIGGGSIDSSLQAWAKNQKFIPWVAIAAQVGSTGKKNESFFTVLPLPIPTGQPVHIHGYFSLSPDRARLHQFGDKSTQDKNPARWNDFLFQGQVPNAWAKLLTSLAKRYPLQAAFEKWPQAVSDPRDPLDNALATFLYIVSDQSLALWPTAVGYVTQSDGLLATSTIVEALKEALEHVKVPVVFVPPNFQGRVEGFFKDRFLCPKNLCTFLESKNNQIGAWNEQTKNTILEYLLSETGFTGYDNLDIFPFQDGTYRSLKNSISFVHRNELENHLFSLDKSRTLDLGKLSKEAQRALKDGCEHANIHPSIQYRSTRSLREYCMSRHFVDVPVNQDTVVLDDNTTKFAAKIWDWIALCGIEILDEHVSCLWLLPLSNGHHRKLKPQSSSSQVYFVSNDEIGELVQKIDAKASERPLPLLARDLTQATSSSMLILNQKADFFSQLHIKDTSNIVAFLEWLRLTSPFVDNILDDERTSHIEIRSVSFTTDVNFGGAQGSCSSFFRTEDLSEGVVEGGCRQSVCGTPSVTIRTCSQNFRELVLTWTSLNSSGRSVGLLDGKTVVPDIDGIQFLMANWLSPSKTIIKDMKLAECLGSIQIIEDYIIPAWKNGQADTWMPSCKEQVAEFIFGRFSSLSLSHQNELRTIPMVPATRLNGKPGSRFSLPTELIDPDVPELKSLCFDDEEIIPKGNFLKFSAALKGSGLKTTIDKDVAEHRARFFASAYVNARYPLEAICERAIKLLESLCSWNFPHPNNTGSDLQRLSWLPIVDLNGELSLKSAQECRGRRDRLLVDPQLPILDLFISSDWEARLGWNNILPGPTLLSQLSYGIQKERRDIVDAVLTYISQNDLIESLANELLQRRCVFTSSGSFTVPSKAFRPQEGSRSTCDDLHPYLADVERKFWQDHKDLLVKLRVGDRLQVADLLKVQNMLEEKTSLGYSDIIIAIKLLTLASNFPRESLGNIKVLSATGTFHPIHDISFDDLDPIKPKDKVNLTHPDIPRNIIRILGIGSLREKLIKGILEIEDANDEDEFDQRENVVTRIADNLHRYPVETTFREYLANADDVEGTSKLSWLLDKRYHPHDKLLTPEMKRFQGPAFLVHNDGVFSDNDWKGFKNVGEGSKEKNENTIGQFGRGSQTMYHWTDVPMILSGKWLVILDPQQEVLPINQIKVKRKPGVKLDISRLRDACPDQLIPFKDLWGYTPTCDHYPGTIFRFPLRTSKTKSVLRQSKRELNSDEVCQLMTKYFDEARLSLLFLTRIKSIDFSVHGKSEFGWSVNRKQTLNDDGNSFSELVVCSINKNTEFGKSISGNDYWWVAIMDLPPAFKFIPDSPRRVMKSAVCGIASLIYSKSNSGNLVTTLPKVMEPKIFNSIPLPISSDLPVYIHGTFFLSGDRRSIVTEQHGMQSDELEWNRYLLQEALPELYFSFLDSIGNIVREKVFDHWPHEQPPKGSCAELLCDSFWEKLPNSSRRVFPKAESSAVRAGKRRPAELLDIKQAIFDFLPESQSDILAPLLISLGVNLVRKIPTEILKNLRKFPEVKSVTRSLLQELLKTDKSMACLLVEMAKNPTLFEVLIGLVTPKDTELRDLDGCYLLPLADRTLEKLRFIETGKAQTVQYYVATEGELKLFDFALMRLVSPSTGSKFGRIFQSSKFNITKLAPRHTRELLKMRPNVATSNEERDKWLAAFWKFWNRNTFGPESPDVEKLDAELLRATVNGVVLYVKPADFYLFPGVVEPSTSDHQKLCDRIPGIYRFDAKLMPESLARDQESFSTTKSFYRFIKALKILAGKTEVKEFVASHLDSNALEALRCLVVWHLSMNNIEDHESKTCCNVLKMIPMWPSLDFSLTQPLIPASNALMTTCPSLLVPWMKESHRFVEHPFSNNTQNQKCLSKLGVQSVHTDLFVTKYVLPLPSTVANIHWSSYLSFIDELSATSNNSQLSLFNLASFLPILTKSRLAIDGDRNLKTPCELFDHSDQIFASAFRHESDARFLHTSLRRVMSFWLKIGLRHREANLIDYTDYMQCLQAMKVRMSASDLSMDPHLKQDSQTVLSPLTSPSSLTDRYPNHIWREISKERVFLSRVGFNGEPEYRKDTMASIAASKRVLQLSEIISNDHTAVCWSQTPFPSFQPTKEILSKFTNGKPKATMVWQHLRHLQKVAQTLKRDHIRDFLEDLKLTYDHLQEHLPESFVGFSLSNIPVWLNLDAMDHKFVLLADIKSSWYGINDLVLSSSCDAGPIKAVRPGLMRYERLLRAEGCTPLIYPTVAPPELHLHRSVSRSLRQLRSEGKMLDITYITEKKIIQAHRVVLAAASEKCALQFSGRWKEEDIIKYDEDTDLDDFLSYHTLSTMINYAYEDDIEWTEMEVSDEDDAEKISAKLDLLLDLAKGADCWLIPGLKSEVEAKILNAGKTFMTLENVVELRDDAKRVGLKNVMKMCETFIMMNKGIVEKAHSDTRQRK